MRPSRVCVVTGSRAEYGLLSGVMGGLRDDPGFELQVAATGMHLSPEFGLTVREIEADGFPVHERVETLLSSDTGVGVAKSLGLGVIGFADALARLRPDLLLLLGDRFEILAAAQAALFARVPVAHIAGGDLTEGAMDDAMRHAITKMAHLHFATHEDAARRVRQLGEDPARIHVTGSPAIDRLLRLRLLSREELEGDIGFRFRKRNLVVTFHPATLSPRPALEELEELLAALDSFGSNVGLLFTRPNADAGGRALSKRIDGFAAGRENARVYASLGQLRYFSAVAQADAVVGNSSSGLYEVPSLGKPTVNVGDRQKGRLRAASVLDCEPREADIAATVRRAFETDCAGTVNPYGDGRANERILGVLRALEDPTALLVKRFRDLELGR